MKFSTFSIVVGSRDKNGNHICNQSCPFCISKLTGDFWHGKVKGTIFEHQSPFYRNFRKGCLLAKQTGTTTVLITGKGEPMMKTNKSIVNRYLEIIDEFEFPIVEIQTNGQFLNNNIDGFETDFQSGEGVWNNVVNTICLSVVHYDQKKAKEIIPNAINLELAIKKAHSLGFSVRVGLMLMKEGIHDISEVSAMINFCRKNEVEQLTIRPISNDVLDKDFDCDVFNWISTHKLTDQQELDIYNKLMEEFSVEPIMVSSYGSYIYDIEGMNVCLTNCLTHSEDENCRQLIFADNGHLYYDWDINGAIIF